MTWLCHLWLGATIGLAPLAAWLAVGGPVVPAPFALWLAVACWVAGFDLFYSLFDLEIDREQGLHSLAVRFGVAGVFLGARSLHLVTVVALAFAGTRAVPELCGELGSRPSRYCCLRASDRLAARSAPSDAAFFTVNGVIAVVFLALFSRTRSREMRLACRLAPPFSILAP